MRHPQPLEGGGCDIDTQRGVSGGGIGEPTGGVSGRREGVKGRRDGVWGPGGGSRGRGLGGMLDLCVMSF